MKLIIVIVIFCVVALIVNADVMEDQSIEVSGNIQCCEGKTMLNLEYCEPPLSARIELWDYWRILPNTLLYSQEIQGISKYAFKWEDSKLLTVKPLLKVRVECKDGTLFNEEYNYTQTQPNKISRDVRVITGIM